MTGFEVTPESFGPIANSMRDIGSQVVQAWQPVEEQSMAVQFGRGDDLLSPLIQVSLQGAVQIMNSSMNSVAGALSDYADGLDAVARIYAGAENDTKSMLQTPDAG